LARQHTDLIPQGHIARLLGDRPEDVVGGVGSPAGRVVH
jgi:hypothetical protein